MSNQTLNHYRAFIKKSKALRKKEKDILLMRLENISHKQISEGYGYKSKERIRSIEARALFNLFGFIVIGRDKIISKTS
ncbi:hypothetical protein A2963_00380 [Candidatus Roizmanbacteria bacterium RIFCSPLOWO2_01_FULL_40_13]|nr:MAG: hypothetical protein A2963_00380 [Candidatus Roizmanbacteria bacterium RIFCSPLOWO2_01_FULL_40_13]